MGMCSYDSRCCNLHDSQLQHMPSAHAIAGNPSLGTIRLPPVTTTTKTANVVVAVAKRFATAQWHSIWWPRVASDSSESEQRYAPSTLSFTGRDHTPSLAMALWKTVVEGVQWQAESASSSAYARHDDDDDESHFPN
jgi:hypothetical protein